MIVIDASALTGLLLADKPAVEAVARAVVEHEDQPLRAPELVEPETLNALRRLVLRRAITDVRATQAAAHLAAVRLVRYPHAALRERVWDLRHELTAYDATYLALAEALGGATLITADRGLAERARRALGADRVVGA